MISFLAALALYVLGAYNIYLGTREVNEEEGFGTKLDFHDWLFVAFWPYFSVRLAWDQAFPKDEPSE